MALVVLALGAINMLAVAWWVMGMVPGSSGGSSSGGSSSSAPPPPPLWSPEEEKAMKASPAAFTDIMSARMQEEAYTAAKAAASKVVDNLSIGGLAESKEEQRPQHGFNRWRWSTTTWTSAQEAWVACCARGGRRNGAL
jgi:hypothetical protein